MKEIKLTKGKVTLVDDEDYARLEGQKYYAVECRDRFYAARSKRVGGRTTRIYLHRELLSPAGNLQVDHINGNGLDNRRCNLRLCSHRDNLRSQRKQRRGSSQYKGVSIYNRDSSKWVARINWRENGVLKGLHLGIFDSEADAARAYNAAAVEKFGAFAKVNKV